VVLEPPTDPEQFIGDAALIRSFLNDQGYHVRQMTRSGMGVALVQFSDVVSRDTAVDRSPFFVGEIILRVLPQNRSLNHRNCTFTHDVWLMMMNFPLEAWHVEKIRESVSEFGKFIVWNRDASNRARILVKIRVPDMLEIPISHVLCENTNDSGHGHSWTVVNYILQANLIDGLGGDDDPLPPDGGNPHPLPNLPFGGIWEDADFVHNMMHENATQPHIPATPAHGHVAPAAPADENFIPEVNTPPQHSPGNQHMMENLQPAIEAMEAFDAIHKVIGNLMEGFHDIPAMLELLEHSSVDGASFKLLDVVEGDIHEKKAIFTIYTSSDPEPHQSKCIISEIEEDTSSFSDASYIPIDDHEESDALMFEEEELSAHMTTPTPAPKK
jgi:hypothetical protein